MAIGARLTSILISTDMDNSARITARNSTDNHRGDIGRRRPIIPVGIVTARLGQLKTLTNGKRSIGYKDGSNSRSGLGCTLETGSIPPASRGTNLNCDTPPQWRLDAERSRLINELSAKAKTSCQRLVPGPSEPQKYDTLPICNESATARQSHSSPTIGDMRLELEPASNNKPRIRAVIDLRTGWGNGDGVQDRSTERAHICHSCGELISFDEPCLSCGHAFCSRCTADIDDESSNSQSQIGIAMTPSSSAAPNQQDKYTRSGLNNNNSDVYRWSNENENPTTSISSSSRSISQAKTLSSVYLNQPVRHCICCFARQPIASRQTVATVPNHSLEGYDLSSSGSSTATHASTVSNLRLPNNIVEEGTLRPAALRPHRSPPAPSAVQLNTKSSDPYIGKRLLRPHPREPEPETERWPKLRQVAEASNIRPSNDREGVPWDRNALRRVSRPATGERSLYPKPATNSEWVKKLKKVNNTVTNADASNNHGWQPQAPNSPLDRSKQDYVYCDRNRSESVRRSERPVSSTYDEPRRHASLSRAPTKSPTLITRTSRTNSRQVEGSLPKDFPALGNESRCDTERPSSGAQTRSRNITVSPRDGRPSGIMKLPNRAKSRDQHSCLWRDRFMDLSAEVDQLRSELDSCEPREAFSPQGEPDDHECDDVGIDGLTVVIHLKGRDDLVINTDLRAT